MDKVEFWKRPPRPLFQDLRAWSLFVPAILSAIGLSVFAVFGFSFTALPSLDDAVLNRAVVFGGLCLAIGGELGTFSSSIEVFRKRAGGQAVLLDYAGLVVSLKRIRFAEIQAMKRKQELRRLKTLGDPSTRRSKIPSPPQRLMPQNDDGS